MEVERFEVAAGRSPWLAEWLARGADRVVVAAELARSEPRGRPAPDDESAATWRVPGPGAHVRHMLAERWAAEHREDGGPNAETLERCFVFGFLLRVLEEQAAPQE